MGIQILYYFVTTIMKKGSSAASATSVNVEIFQYLKVTKPSRCITCLFVPGASVGVKNGVLPWIHE
jgi:hypothetical protein